MQDHVAKVSYLDPQNARKSTIVGAFSTEEKARAAIGSFRESVLELEFPEYGDFGSEIQEFELDREWLG